MPLAAIALGSNLGDRKATLADAIRSLASVGHVVAVSPWIETEPVGYTDQPNGLQLIAYVAVIVGVTMLARWERTRHPKGGAIPNPA